MPVFSQDAFGDYYRPLAPGRWASTRPPCGCNGLLPFPTWECSQLAASMGSPGGLCTWCALHVRARGPSHLSLT